MSAASVKINSESGYSSSRSSSVSNNNNDKVTMKSKIRQTNLMDFFFNAKENKNNNEIVSSDINSADISSDRRKSAISAKTLVESEASRSKEKIDKRQKESQRIPQDVIQNECTEKQKNTNSTFAMRRSRRLSICDGTLEALKQVPKSDKEKLTPNRKKSVCFVTENLLSEKAAETTELNDNEPRILEEERKEVNADKAAIPSGFRRSRRQSICVDKLNFERVEARKLSYKKFIDEIAPLPETTADNLIPKENNVEEKKDCPAPIARKICRRKSICVPTFNMKYDELNYIDPMIAMMIRSASKVSASYAQVLKKAQDENDLLIKSTEIVSSKRPRDDAEKSVEEVKQSAKRLKINETEFEEVEPQTNQPAIVEEIIEDIWHVSVTMTLEKDPVVRFLVKWDGFPPSENTLEPYEHVSHAEVLQEYVERKFEMHQDRIDAAIMKLTMESKEHVEFYQRKTKNFVLKKLSKFNVQQFRCNILAYIYTYEKIPISCQFLKQLRFHCILYQFFEKVEREQKFNKSFLAKIMKKEMNLFQITSENKLDYDAVPNFEYLRNVDFPEKSKSSIGCQCEETCNASSNCCPSLMGVKPVYDVDGRIMALSHQMIVECNDHCKCDQSCFNRPKRTKFNLCVFKTADRGWAVKTLDHIPAGTFVIEYTGEVIDMNEAKKRTRVYKKLGITYLFDLDYNEQNEATFSLDATQKGNLSRFINHACNANLQTWPATSCNDMNDTHRLYYFSLRSIRAGEELTVDYSGGVIRPKMNPPKDAIPCKCNSDNCRGYIF